MNCRLGDLRSLGKHTLVPRALERHAMPDRLMMEDAALAEEARNGNSAAFVKLANRWWTPLYRVSWIVSGSASCATQITERTLLGAIRSSGAATFYESSVQSVPLSSCGPLDAHARAACVD